MSAMKIGETITHNWFGGGGGKIIRTEKGYELYEVTYSKTHYIDTYETLEEAKAHADTWT